MMKLLLKTYFVLFFLTFCLVSQAFAEPELHAVAIYEGYIGLDRERSPTARVVVDRPGSDVVLYLSDQGPVDWYIEVSEFTRIDKIFIGGYRPDLSKIHIENAANVDVEYENFRPVVATRGRSFHTLVSSVKRFGDFDRFSSFQTSYTASSSPFFVRSAPIAAGVLDPNYLAKFLEPAVGFEADREPLIDAPTKQPAVIFKEDGLIFSDDLGGETFYPIHGSVPQIDWPTAALFVPEKNSFYATSIGGEGHLFRLDADTSKWSHVMSLGDRDVHGLIYDPQLDRLILSGNEFGGKQLYFYDFTTKSLETISISEADLVGITDLYEFDSRIGPQLIPIGVENEHLLLRALPLRHNLQDFKKATISRTWEIDLLSWSVRLVSFTNF